MSGPRTSEDLERLCCIRFFPLYSLISSRRKSNYVGKERLHEVHSGVNYCDACGFIKTYTCNSLKVFFSFALE